uniref:THAP domain containing 6 [Heterocephalus glaber] n=1 Tax=Lepeophtheirus salmonis TaxID=72036 RepID=A0A0K2UWM5_LEPSM
MNRINLNTNNLGAPSLHSKVCHEHFKKEDYDRPGGWDPDVPRLRKCLKKGVLPLIFLYRRSTEPSFHEKRYKNCQQPNEVNTTQDDVKVRYIEDNVNEGRA